MPQFNSVRCRSGLTGALLALACGAAPAQQTGDALIRDGLATPDPVVASTLPHYLDARSARLVDWLADGSLLIETRFADVSQIHRLRAPLGMREQVSFAAEGVSAAAVRPYASDAFAFLERHPATGTSQLLLQRLDTHQVSALTDGRALDGAPLWAHDGKLLAFTSNRRNGVDSDIYLLDSANAGAPRLVVNGAGFRWRIFDWSGDDQKLLLGRESTGQAANEPELRDVELFIADVNSGQLAAVTREPAPDKSRRKRGERATGEVAPISARSARFAADGRTLLALSGTLEPEAQFQHLYSIDPASHQISDLTAETRHDVERFDRSIDGHYIAYVVNDGGISRLTLIDQQRKLDLAINDLPPGIIRTLRFDAAGKQLALSEESARSPADVYVFDPEAHALTRWTQGELGGLDPKTLVQPESVHFPTWDRVDGAARQLPALVYRAATPPPGASGAPPVLILLCSGGGTQCRPGFDPWLQFLVNELGIVVVAPDLRGSSGYGRSFQQLGEGTLSDDAVRDVGSLLVWIGLQRELDRSRVAIAGEGYGSYLALESLAAYGDRLRGGIAAFGPRLSPLGNIPAIRKPLLLVQGLNNPAAPANEIEQLRARLRLDGVSVQYLAAADEGASFTRRSDRDAYWSAAANFLLTLFR